MTVPLFCVALVESVADRFLDDPPAAATILQLRAARALFSGDAGGYLTITRRTADMFEAAGDLRAAAAQRGNAGYACIKLGAYDEAVRLLRAALETAEQNGYSTVITGALVNLGFALGRTGAFTVPTGIHLYMEYDCVDLDIGRLRLAFRKVVKRHDMLRAHTLPDMTQVIEPEGVGDIEERDLRPLPPAGRDAELAAMADTRISLRDGKVV